MKGLYFMNSNARKNYKLTQECYFVNQIINSCQEIDVCNQIAVTIHEEPKIYIISRNIQRVVKQIDITMKGYGLSIQMMPQFDYRNRPYMLVKD